MLVLKLRSKGEKEWYRANGLAFPKGQDITAMTKKAYYQLKNPKKEDRGFCHQRFKANVVFSYEGHKEKVLSAEGTFFLGEKTLMEITKKGKRCFSHCPLYLKKGKACDFVEEVFFLEAVIKGSIKQGERIFMI